MFSSLPDVVASSELGVPYLNATSVRSDPQFRPVLFVFLFFSSRIFGFSPFGSFCNFESSDNFFIIFIIFINSSSVEEAGFSFGAMEISVRFIRRIKLDVLLV